MDKKKLDEFAENVKSKTNEILNDSLIDEESDNEVIDYNDIVKNNMKARMSKVPWLMTIFLVLLVSIFLVSSFLQSNPQTIFTNTIDKFFGILTDEISDVNYEITRGKVNIKFDVKSEEEKEFYDNLNKYDYNINYVLDSANSLSKVDLDIDGDDKLSINLFSDKNESYIYLKDIYDKYINLNELRPYRLIGNNDIKIVLNGLNQAFDKVATSEKITGSKSLLDIDNKTVKVYESKLVINSQNYERVAETFINSLKSNPEFISSLAKSKNSNSRNVKKALDRFLPELKQTFKENLNIEIILLNDRKTNDFIKGQIVSEKGTFSLAKKDNKFEFSLSNKEKGTLTNGSLLTTFNKDKTNNKFDLSFETKKDDKIVSSGTVKINSNFKEVSEFENVDLSGFVLESEITDLEKLAIYTRLYTHPILNKFISLEKVV